VGSWIRQASTSGCAAPVDPPLLLLLPGLPPTPPGTPPPCAPPTCTPCICSLTASASARSCRYIWLTRLVKSGGGTHNSSTHGGEVSGSHACMCGCCCWVHTQQGVSPPKWRSHLLPVLLVVLPAAAAAASCCLLAPAVLLLLASASRVPPHPHCLCCCCCRYCCCCSSPPLPPLTQVVGLVARLAQLPLQGAHILTGGAQEAHCLGGGGVSRVGVGEKGGGGSRTTGRSDG
jgi:hypothetical protein